MLILELSAGQGPAECCQAVSLALRQLQREARAHQVAAALAEQVPGPVPDSLQSVLLQLSGSHAAALAERWQGTLLWICPSRLRPHHGRKNWYFAGAIHLPEAAPVLDGVRIETLRSGGAGGQHVNKTESAVRAVHIATGISVRVETERSQHANRRLALALLARKLEQVVEQQRDARRAQRRQFHHDVERGNPRRTFVGIEFRPGD